MDKRMSYFWGLSLGLLGGIYCLRVAIRSQFVRRSLSHLKRRAATAGGRVPARGQDIPTSAWIRSVWTFAWSTPWSWCILAATLVGLPLALIWSASQWELWEYLLATNLVLCAFCVLAQTVNIQSPVQRPCRTLLLAIMVLGIPVSLLWTFDQTWPHYAPLTATAILTLVFATLRHRLCDELGYISSTMVGLLCASYLVIYPALLIWEGEIPAVNKHWTVELKAGVTLLGMACMAVIVVLHWVFVCTLVRHYWAVGPVISKRTLFFLGYLRTRVRYDVY
jgi:hypothetical protein